MDNAAVMSMWAEDGISLLPTTDPIIGKAAIGKFMDEVMGRMPGYHMQRMDVDFQGIEVSGDCASEWAEEHQVVQPPPGKRVIDSYGKLLLVLHREADGNWRITREMWNQGLKP
jgi:ketosteroid isomerase-like protein